MMELKINLLFDQIDEKREVFPLNNGLKQVVEQGILAFSLINYIIRVNQFYIVYLNFKYFANIFLTSSLCIIM